MNLFLSTSPLQLICCIEAKRFYNTKNNILILREERSLAGNEQINKLLDKSEWDSVLILKRNSKIWNTARLIHKIKSLNPSLQFEHFFFADYLAWRTNVLLANIKASNEVMLDDGTNTISTFKTLIETEQHVYRNKRSRDILMSALGIKKARVIYPRKTFRLFTFFNLVSKKFPIDRNDFITLKDRLNINYCFSETAPVGFIGQGLVGSRGMKITEYCNLLKTIIKKHPRGLIYFPHRSETKDVENIVRSIVGVNYRKTSSPIEFEISNEEIKLSTIYGITSAASFTLSKIYTNIPIYDIEVPIEKYEMPLLGETLESLRKEIGLPYAELPDW
ncbi:hypothetical protein M2H36_20185 [Vibrio vulnificus]|nr:hypothetical protein [Vibrio vulnificus]